MLQSWGLHVVFWWCPVHGSSQSPQSEQSEHVLSLPRGTRRIVIARIPTQRACVSRASKRASALLFRQYYSRQLSYSPNPIVVGRMAFIADTGLLVGTRRLSRRLSRRLIGVGHFNVCVTEARLLQDSSKSRDNERATPGLCLRSCKQHVVGRQASDMQCVSVWECSIPLRAGAVAETVARWACGGANKHSYSERGITYTRRMNARSGQRSGRIRSHYCL